MRIQIDEAAIEKMAQSGRTAALLYEKGRQVASHVDAPNGMEVEVRASKGPNINAQVVMTGELSGGLWPLGVEYGTIKFPARAPLRRALDRLR